MTRHRIAAAIAAAILIVLVGCGAYSWSSGVRFYAVDSGSMAPTFNTGALVVDEPVGPTTILAIGDVITFHPTPAYTVTHRVVGISKDGITTKGDANPTSDVGLLQQNMVVGRVAFSIPYGGYAVVFLRNPLAVAALLVLFIGLAVVWELTAVKPRAEGSTTSLGEDLR